MASVLNVPFVDLARQFRRLEPELTTVFNEVGRSGVYILGPWVEQFETAIAAYCGVKHAVGVADGSAALFLPLKALGIGAGDEVITASNSFIASAWVIVATGAKPVLTDVRTDLNMDPRSLVEAITPRTKAIIPVHLAGRPAPMQEIMAIADELRIPVIEDAAQAIGARYRGKAVGSFGIAAGFSLHPLKNLGLYGDGGFVTTNDDALAEKLRLLRNHGLRTRNDCELWGYNSRLDAMQAAFALVKLRHLDAWNVRCRQIASMYRAGVRSFVEVPEDREFETNVYHNFIINTSYRDELATYLKAKGVGTAVHYPVPIHLQKAAIELGYRQGSFPIAERLSKNMLSLPIYPELEDLEVNFVIEQIEKFFKNQ
jgi:dTDP-4-amino-4,6-dideoxygalactose transaminase